MGDKSGIEWTDATWNPITGCTKISPGCAHCYAERITLRFGRGPEYLPGKTEIQLHPERLDQPIRWQRSRRIFVCSMSDLFHEEVSFAFIDRVFDVMVEASHHIFQVLTKRPERMVDYAIHRIDIADRYCDVWPAHVWAGTSVENQWWADRRIPPLQIIRGTPSSPPVTRFLSMEPLLKPVDLRPHLEGIGWVIVGGESGPRARPMEADWARSLRDQCAEAGVPFFMKQMARRAEIPEDLMVREWPR